ASLSGEETSLPNCRNLRDGRRLLYHPDVHTFIGNFVRQFARKRIDRLDAIALAYMGQLVLNGRAAIHRQLQLEQDRQPSVIVDVKRPDRETGSGGQSTS